MNYFRALSMVLLMNPPASADFAEQRLLQEWGMQWSKNGSLELVEPPVAQAPQTWRPELSLIDPDGRTDSPVIEPIVIRPR